MDKQKSLPPVTKKITRKLAQESAGHNSLMNYYSSISRDETGAPKKWKMSSPLRIDEDLIASGKLTSGKSSPGASRESSGERRKSLAKRNSNRDSSSEYSSSRDSSLESKGKGRGDSLDRSDKNKSIPQLNGGTSVKNEDKKKGKRGRRPRSLDLSSKTLNGDDDKFKSPDPLTPCNIFVKRRKGRPKETPPTLVAETPVENSPKDSDSEEEDDADDGEIISKKKGRTARKALGRGSFLNKNLNARKSVKQTKFALKRNLNKGGYGKLPKLTKMKPAIVSYESELVNHDANGSELKASSSEKENGDLKRGPGRPPGAKNKPKLFLKQVSNRKKGGKGERMAVFRRKTNLGRAKVVRKPGKPPGARNKQKPVVPSVESVETVSNSSKENNSISVQTEEDMMEPCYVLDTAQEESNNETKDTLKEMSSNASKNLDDAIDAVVLQSYNYVPEDKSMEDIMSGVVKSFQRRKKTLFQMNPEVSQNVDEAIDAVLYKASNDLPLDPPSNNDRKLFIGLEVRGRVKSLAKIKKKKDAENKMRRKRILLSQHKHIDARTVDVLPINDLRRKLHSKMLKKQALMKIQERLMKVVSPNAGSAPPVETEIETSEDTKKASVFHTDVFYTSSSDAKEQTKPGIETQSKLLPKGRKFSVDHGDLKKFSDTESICSELSTNSFSSTKRLAEKHILVLGEDHNESDDSSIRTRQRFEIVPGKSRKRTLSGEYDLLDEKQLRKERKLAEKTFTDDENDGSVERKKVVPKKKKSPLKRSPPVKVRDPKIVEKYGASFKARKLQLLRQSPFLMTHKRRRRKGIKKKITMQSPLRRSPNQKSEVNGSSSNSYSVGKKEDIVLHLDGMNKSEVHRMGLFEQFDDVNMNSVEQKGKTDQIDDKNITDRPEGKQNVLELIDTQLEEKLETQENEPETIVKSLLTEIVYNVMKQCEPEIEAVGINKDNKDNIIAEQSELNEIAQTLHEEVEDQDKVLDTNDQCSLTEEQTVELETKVKNEFWKKRKGGRGRGRRKFGPLPIARNIEKNPKPLPKGRKKSVSKPELGEAVRVKRKYTARKTNQTQLASSPPDSTVTRKFELRQKISRSPLDNIALKQSLEENKYLKIEQQRAIRKEAKLKSRMKASNQDSMESLQSEVNQSDVSEGTVDPATDPQTETEDEVPVEIKKHPTIDELKRKCKPCSIMLVDFIKKLHIQEDDSSSSENDTESADDTLDTTDTEFEVGKTTVDNALEMEQPCETEQNKNVDANTSENVQSVNSCVDEPKENVITCELSEEPVNEVVKSETETVSEEVKCEEVKLELKKTEESKTVDDNTSNANTSIANTGNAECEQAQVNPVLETKLEEKMETTGAETKEVTSEKTNEIETVELKQTTETVVPKASPRVNKTKVETPKKAGKTPPRRPVITEPQTARKTVPPLKIKVKGSTRRKTYMVEPSPDSPIDKETGLKPKAEKKKKTKSGNKSESSDTEKHNKAHHHHHKKRNKSPSDEIKSKAENESPSKHIKATDAYEANFLQFLQEKDKVENSMLVYTTTAPKNKSNKHILPGKGNTKSINTNTSTGALTNTMAIVNTINSVQIQNKTMAEPFDQGLNDFKEGVEEVRYVCSQCDNVEYKAEELILQHYREVHPGSQVMYKPLPEIQTQPISETRKPEMPLATQQNGAKEQGNNLIDDGNVDDDDDSGSLNLKIVDVVSLKDQESMLDLNVIPTPVTTQVSKPPVLPGQILNMDNSIASIARSLPIPVPATELRIPHYPIPASVAAGVNPNAELYKHLLKNMTRPQAAHIAPTPAPQLPPPKYAGKIAETFKCEKCNVHAPSLAAMVGHLRNAHKEIPRLFQCPYCKELEALTEADIHQHIKQSHPTSDNPNPPVALSEAAKRNLKTLKVGLPESYKLGDSNLLDKDIYQCLICKVHMPSLETIYDHLEQNHSEVFVFVCPFCKEFKSKTEDSVSAHILHVHRRSTADVNISIAIDGTRFVRVQCLVKEKAKKSHTQSHAPHKQQTHTTTSIAPAQIAPAQIQQTVPQLVNSLTQYFGVPTQQPIQTSNILHTPSHVQTATQIRLSNHLQANHLQALNQIQVPNQMQTSFRIQAPTQLQSSSPIQAPTQMKTSSQAHSQPQTLTLSQLLPKPPQSSISSTQVAAVPSSNAGSSSTFHSKPPMKKKKNLLESIEQLKHQKQMEQQGLVPPKSSANSNPSASTTTKAVSGAPPPLMRAPPPLIRYDQLNKVTANASVISTTVKMSTAVPSHINQNTLQRLQSLSVPRPTSSISSGIPPRPIQSSLFDTSDLTESIKTPQRPVLNVPVVSRSSSSSPYTLASSRDSPRVSDGSSSVGVLDLSGKTTPSSSPILQTIPSPNPLLCLPKESGLNTDVFKVFNLKPNQLNTPMQIPRPVGTVTAPGQAVIAQPILMPQQVRQNTPSTLAYRPPAGQMIATSIPQIINMPMGAVIGNMVVSLANMPQGIPQFVRMSGPMSTAGLVPVSSTSQANAIPIATPAQPLVNINMNMMFRCPYCPNVVPLNMAQVPPHIESQHPGHSIMYTPMEKAQ